MFNKTFKIESKLIYEWFGVITGIVASLMLASGITNIVPFAIYTMSCLSFILYGLNINAKGVITLNAIWLFINLYGIIIRI